VSPRRIAAIAAAAVVVAALVVAGVRALRSGDAVADDRPVGNLSAPQGLSIGTGGVWVARRGAGRVSLLGDHGPPRRSSAALDGPVGRVAAGSGAIWASGENGSWIVPVVAVDPEHLRGRDLVDLKLPTSPCQCPDPDLAIAAGTLWAGDRPNGRILARDLGDGTDAGRVEMPDGFEGRFAVGRGGSEIWAVAGDPRGAATGSSLVWFPTDPADLDRRLVFALDADLDLKDVAYGETKDAVWLLDGAGGRGRVLRYPGAVRQEGRHPDDSGVSAAPTASRSVIDLPRGFGADRIAVDPDSGTALVLDLAHGELARIGSSSTKVDRRITVPDFPKDTADPDRFFSDLVASSGVAYVSDPTAGVVHRLRY
jgi:hypothetical protein